MKALLKIVSVLFISLISIQAFSQSFEFRVLASRGENSVKKANSSSWESIKTGATLFAGSKIKVGESGYLGLMHKSGKTMQLNKSGEFVLSELSSQVLTQSSSVTSKYGEFLMAKMSDSGDDNVSNSRLNNLNVTGAVSRATDEEEIQLFLPKTSKIISYEDTRIKWKELENADYKVYVENLYNETIVEKDAADNFIDLSALNIDIEQEGGVFLKVMSEGEETATSSMHAIEVLSASERTEILKNLKNLKAELSNDDLSLKKLILAIFYEENKLYLHAFSCYNEVLSEYPDVNFYKSAYVAFVERNKEKFK